MHRCPESFKLRCAALLASALLSGCMSVPVPELPAQVPAAWSQAAGRNARAVDLRSWWTALDDPRLNALVEEALRRNLDLEQSARLLQGEREVAGRWRSRYLPGFGVGARPVQDAQAKIPISTPASTWSGSWACSARPRAAGCRPARTPTWPPLASRACACRWSRPWCATIWTWAWPTVRSRC